jgi:para-nitrobenzyl esterase
MDKTIIETRFGPVRGADLGSVMVWKAIPYAAPPVGARRFQRPAPPEPWAEARDATHFGPIAPQAPFRLANGTLNVAMPEPQSEDCLYLNIWAPQPDGQRRPVMVWLHGGALLNGSGSQADYDGASFAARGDLVVVTLNYRLGVLGFLALEEVGGATIGASANCGLLDQVAALQWVRENIAAFGGDPTNVTAFGESAGAICIAMLLGMPAARGLFRRAILQSGPATLVEEKAAATRKARKFLDILGLEANDIATLTTIPTEQVLAAQATLIKDGRLGGIQPYVDGKHLVETPMQALARGGAKDIALLIGTNRDEARLFTETITGEKREPPIAMSAGALPPAIRKQGPTILRTYSKNVVAYWLAVGRAALKLPSDGNDGLRALLLAAVTDYAARIPAIRMAEQQTQQGGQVWMYRFDWPSPLLAFGACHALELPFVWNTLDAPTFRLLLGAHPPRHLAQGMHDAWIAFARSGDPNSAELPSWPTYDLDRRSTMIFDDVCQVINDPQAAQREVWRGLL